MSKDLPKLPIMGAALMREPYIIPHSEREIVGKQPCEVVFCGRDSAGRRLYDVWCNEIGDYVATIPAFPTTDRERAEACAQHGNEQAAKRGGRA